MKPSKKQTAASPAVAPSAAYSKYLFILFFVVVVILAFLVVRPFLSTLIVSGIIVYVFHPIYRYFYRITDMKGFSAVILIVMMLLVFSIPFVIVAGKLVTESYSVYLDARQALFEAGSVSAACADRGGVFCTVYGSVSSLFGKYGLDFGSQVVQGMSEVAAYFVSRASGFVMDLPKLFLHVFISLFAMYYMFVQGEGMVAAIKRALPMRESHSERILSHFNDIIHATIYGAIVIAIVQGFVACIGFFIFGIDSPILLGLLTMLAAFIPFLGAALVWLPASVSLLISGFVADDSSMMLRAGGLVIYGALLISTIDNFIRPKIVGDKAKVHPLVVLLGVFGGLAFFGFAGIMIGPLLLTLFIASLKIYEQEKHNLS